MFFAVQFLVCS